MKNKIKIIELLNKIANGEEIPEKIRVKYRIFEKYLNHNAYLNTKDEENYKYLTDLPRLYDDDRDWLNEEVEILDDEEDKDIPLIPDDELIILKQSKTVDMQYAIDFNFRVLKEKINQIIEVINNDSTRD